MHIARFKFPFSKTLCAIAASFILLASPANAVSTDDASHYIENLGNKAVETITSKNLSKAAKNKKIEQLFRDNVDVNWVGRFVTGRFWRQATDEQKKHYLKEYETFLVQHYATRFTDYTGGSFKINGVRDDGDNEFTVSTQIKSDEAGSAPVLVDWRVRTGEKNNLVIFDIIVEGVSMITTQRSEFTSVITNKGFDYLINQLSTKSDSLAPATP